MALFSRKEGEEQGRVETREEGKERMNQRVNIEGYDCVFKAL